MGNIFQIPLSASLARRLAEAADGFRNVDQVYFIAGYERPHRIKDFPDLTSAQSFFEERKLKDSEYAIFGPYKTTDDLEKYDVARVENYAKIEVTIHFKNGGTETISLPGEIDSIFFNLSSIDKFLLPYYTHLYGVDYAKIMRENFIAQAKAEPAGKSGKVGHFNRTIAFNIGPPGEDFEG